MRDKHPVNIVTGKLNTAFDKLSDVGLPPGSLERAVAQPARRGRVVLRREKAHRAGKTVIVVHDFALSISSAEIEMLGVQLKKACGSGGTVKDRVIEIQGNQASKIRTLLETEGFQVAGER